MSKLRIALTFLIVSALPLIVSMAVVYFGSLASHSSDYWAVNPWLVVAAVYVTPGWALIVAIGLGLYVRFQKKRATPQERVS
jgi:hypothetical protein